jgi:nitroreductase/dihydropteridine reductase
MTMMAVPHSSAQLVLDALRWRYATKAFDPAQPVSAEDIDMILEAVRLAPTSMGLQPFHVTVVTDPATKKAMRKAAYDQGQLTSASHILVFSAKPSIEDHARKMWDGLRENGAPEEAVALLRKYCRIDNIIRTLTFSRKSWAARQSFIPLGFALMTAAELGIDCCPMEGFSPGKIAKILDLPKGLPPVALLALGYRSPMEKVRPKYRLPIEELVSHR